MMKKLPFILVLLVIMGTLALPVIVFAQGNAQGVTLEQSLRPDYSPDFPLDQSNPSSRAAVGNIVLQLIAGSLIYAAGPVAVMMIAIGGFRYVVSHGDQNQMDGAKKTITWAIVGLLVIIVSYAIVTNIISIAEKTGQQTTQTTGGTPPTSQGGQEKANPEPEGTGG